MQRLRSIKVTKIPNGSYGIMTPNNTFYERLFRAQMLFTYLDSHGRLVAPFMYHSAAVSYCRDMLFDGLKYVKEHPCTS